MSNCSNTCNNNINALPNTNFESKSHKHPCFGDQYHKYARIHLPVAPKCNIQCNYCNRKYDCVNESRPGVTSQILSPKQSFEKFCLVKEKIPNLSVVGYAGPGDVLANFDQVKQSIQLIQEYSPETIFCISTNGLMLPKYASEIIDLGISHITITINTIDPIIGSKIYKHVRYMNQIYTGNEAGELLLENQLEGLKILTESDIVCKINIVAIKGINEQHISEVVSKVKDLGAFKTNIMQLIPTKGTLFEDMPLVSNKELGKIRRQCSVILPQMYHCQQCRADAIGLLHQDRSLEFREFENKETKQEIKPSNNEKEIIFAVASKTGDLVDQHFGHVENFHIYKYSKEKLSFITKRQVNKYCTGKANCDEKENKIDQILNTLNDCNAVISLRIGHEPKRILSRNNIKTFELYDTVENALKKAVNQMNS